MRVQQVTVSFCGLVASASAGLEPRILSCIAGLPKCVGVPDIHAAAEWGCPIVKVTDCSGKTTNNTCNACKSPRTIGMTCAGQGWRNNYTAQDGTPVTFNLPVDMSTVKADHFQWRFKDGSTRLASCAIPNGRPALEGNELQTIAIVGDAGGWSDFAVALEIVGDLMLVRPDGSKVSAKGLSYSGPSLNVQEGPLLLTATYEVFSTKGELLSPVLTMAAYPNHCQHLFPETTHRVVLLFDGGVTYDGRRGITPDRRDLFSFFDRGGAALPAEAVLGLADLGNSIPTTQCEKDTYVHDQDNYVDVCLKMSAETPVPATVHMPCDEARQIVNPKGTRYPCRPQTIEVTVEAAVLSLVV